MTVDIDRLRALAIAASQSQSPYGAAHDILHDAITPDVIIALLAERDAPPPAADALDYTCRSDGRCQYAIDHGAEGLGHCPRGKCAMAPAADAVSELPGYACTIDSADFGEDTVTVQMSSGNYRVSAGVYRLIREDNLRQFIAAALAARGTP